MFEGYKDKSFLVIARRYFVLNGFDGILTVLGISVGSYSAGVSDPFVLLTSGIGAAVALGISGISGACVTEKAERLRKFKDLQDAMLDKLERSVHKDNVEKFSLLISLVNGASPFLLALLGVVPYFLALNGLLIMTHAYYFSFGISLSLLAILGAFLGRISRESMLIYAGKMVVVGVITALLASSLGLGA